MVAVLPDNWQLWVHGAAHEEVVKLRDECPVLFKRLVQEMSRLAQTVDPRRCPNVEPLLYDAKGWYRLSIKDRGYRVVFRLLVDKGQGLFELFPGEAIPPNSREQGIEITRVAHRAEVYNEELRQRRCRIL